MALLTRMPIGKYRGRAFSSIPLAYLGWIVSVSSMTEDIKRAARAELERRGNG